MAVEASKMKLYKLRDIFVMQVWRLDTKMLTDTEILQIRGLLVKTVLRYSLLNCLLDRFLNLEMEHLSAYRY